jgi:ATP-dependent helicase/nuclease subunit A
MAVAEAGRTPLAVHVERTWRSLGGDVALPVEARGNVLRYLGVLREVESEGGRVDLRVLAARLKTLYAEPASAAVVDGRVPIDLMTIHKAKGLEWDVVLVPGLERGGGRAQSVLLNWLEFDGGGQDDGASLVLAPIWSKGTEADKLSEWLSGIRRKREAAERKRVFYVASTRAREEVHLFGAVKPKAEAGVRKPLYGSLLSACWPAAAREFEGLAEEKPQGSSMVEQLMESLRLEDEGWDEGMALAASGSELEGGRQAPLVQRLPLGFDPGRRFREAEERRLAYPAAAELRRAAVFERPEGSFAARAFGNVVHRYLQVMARRLDGGVSTEAFVSELPEWIGRFTASLRGEGLAPVVATREAGRALRALTMTMEDRVGRWILAPHVEGASERELTVGAGSLRVDRTFVAGGEPGMGGEDCVWIVDFKTTEQGARSEAEFEAGERAKYSAQLEAYAAVRRRMAGGEKPIRLGLYYPLVPRLVWWESEGADDSL